MQQRSDDDIIARRPIQVTLGEVQYPLKPLTINQADCWRASLDASMQDVMESFKSDQDFTSALPPSLAGALIRFPKKILEMVYLYSPEIRKDAETIEANASEEQIAYAFGKMMSLAYPFVTHLGVVTQVMRARLES